MIYTDFITYISWKLEKVEGDNEKRNFLKEELQKSILYSIYSRKNNLYFLGWTNLRICYKLDRFSEDLDFALSEPDENFTLDNILGDISSDFNEKSWFPMSIKVGAVSTVQKAIIKFPWILYDTWLSPLKSESIAIKMEVDTNPADGAEYSKEIIKSTSWPCMIKNQNINSTFSWKIGALLLREYIKWRDYYDMYWYLENYSHKTFNLPYIQNVIAQYNNNNGKNVSIPKNHKETLNMVLDKIENTDYKKVTTDLKRFVSWSDDKLNIFFDTYPDNMFKLIKDYHHNIEGNMSNKFRL